jgi:hypothetical protein
MPCIKLSDSDRRTHGFQLPLSIARKISLRQNYELTFLWFSFSSSFLISVTSITFCALVTEALFGVARYASNSNMVWDYLQYAGLPIN